MNRDKLSEEMKVQQSISSDKAFHRRTHCYRCQLPFNGFYSVMTIIHLRHRAANVPSDNSVTP